MSLRYYIQGIGAVSPQNTWDQATFLDEPLHYEENILKSVTPDFKQYINPVALRRMSRIIRIGMSAAKICMTDAALAMPDGILAGTGYGCADDTIRFLQEMLANNEQHLTPTHFTQSTYNALSGAIALSLRCNNYNTTYVHRAFSFESGVLDAMMQIADAPQKRMLIGGFDETDPHHYNITTRVGYYKEETVRNFDLYTSGTRGTIQGEGASFITLGAEPTGNAYATLDGVQPLFGIRGSAQLSRAVERFLAAQGTSAAEIDVVVSGRSGCVVNDQLLLEVQDDLLPHATKAYYKHLTGEYSASAAFGAWVAARILREQRIPAAMLPTGTPTAIRRVLYINQYMGGEYALMLFGAVA